jgi:hypothetical protein
VVVTPPPPGVFCKDVILNDLRCRISQGCHSKEVKEAALGDGDSKGLSGLWWVMGGVGETPFNYWNLLYHKNNESQRKS